VNNVRHVTDHLREIQTANGDYTAKVVCGSYGKYNPVFTDKLTKPAKNYIGVKYHIKTDMAADRIELHNFEKGYCGISKVDEGQYCLCYLSESSNLVKHGKNIKAMEESVLYRNPFLEKYFTESEFVNDQPHVISNITFSKKATYKDGMFLLGDAAGSITPLCGNGMSMAMRASCFLAAELTAFLSGRQNLDKTISHYDKLWTDHFSIRIKTGYHLQHLFGKTTTTNLALKILDNLPGVTSKLISLTHGDRF
ncbi:MAG TPA: oxidoreductase, partial [Dyadobacter sp.]|nr:oxidoreductase [Dyadobacter sp.]